MEKREQPSGHLNLQTAVVAGTPLLDGVQCAHLDALVESARGEDEVKLVVASRLRVLAGEVVRDDVAGVGGFTRRQRLRLRAGAIGPTSQPSHEIRSPLQLGEQGIRQQRDQATVFLPTPCGFPTMQQDSRGLGSGEW